jgi:integrase
MTQFFDHDKPDRYVITALENILKDQAILPSNKEHIKKYISDSRIGKTILKGQKRRIGSNRNIHVISLLRNMNKWFKKDFNDVTMEDMEHFIIDLDEGRIITDRHTPFKDETKAVIKKFIRKFYKWLKGESRTYPPLVDWIDTSFKRAQIEAIPELDKGILRVIELIPDLRRKALLWVSFDSGFREGELINTAIKDLEKRTDGIYYITCRYSKTKPRTVAIALSSELLDRWLAIHPDKDNPDASIWQTSRAGMMKAMRLYTKKALGKTYSVHQIRHTSATYWATRLDRANLCKRLGWSFKSAEADRYIDFAKLEQERVIDVVKSEKYDVLSQEMANMKSQNINLRSTVDELGKNVEQLNALKQELIDRAYKEIMEKLGHTS